MKNLSNWVDDVIKVSEQLMGLFFKLIFGLAPVLLIGFVVIAVMMKAFRVVVLGEQP